MILKILCFVTTTLLKLIQRKVFLILSFKIIDDFKITKLFKYFYKTFLNNKFQTFLIYELEYFSIKHQFLLPIELFKKKNTQFFR